VTNLKSVLVSGNSYLNLNCIMFLSIAPKGIWHHFIESSSINHLYERRRKSYLKDKILQENLKSYFQTVSCISYVYWPLHRKTAFKQSFQNEIRAPHARSPRLSYDVDRKVSTCECWRLPPRKLSLKELKEFKIIHWASHSLLWGSSSWGSARPGSFD